MKKISLLLAILFVTYAGAVYSQTKTENPKATYDYVVMYYKSGYGVPSLVVVNDSMRVDLMDKLKIKVEEQKEKDNSYSEYKKENPYPLEYRIILTGINYMDSQGYELVSSSAYYAGSLKKEYIFRRKKA